MVGRIKILLFGVSNVGKSTTGELLANQLGFKFYDLDMEVKTRMGMTLETFVHTADLRWRDQKRGRIIKELIRLEEDMVLAITPISFTENFRTKISGDGMLAIELYDTPENIFDRLVFSDENDIIYTDDPYKNEHREYYMRDIQADLDWYGKIYAEIGIRNRVFIDNDLPANVVERIISEYNLTEHLKI